MPVNDRKITCFIDTGSEVTVLKEEAAKLLPGIRMLRSSRTLKGVAGMPKSVEAEADLKFTIHPGLDLVHRTCITSGIHFPGDMLVGMDLLRRLPVVIFISPNSSDSYLELDGHRHVVTFVGEESSHCCEVPACHESRGELPESSIPLQPRYVSPVHVTEATTIEPRAGRFVAASLSRSVPDETHVAVIEGNAARLLVPRTLITVQERRSSIWVVNTEPKPRKLSPGTIVGYAELVETSDLQTTSQFLQIPSGGTLKETIDGKAPKLRDSPPEDVSCEDLGSLEISTAEAVTPDSGYRGSALGALNESIEQHGFIEDGFESFDACLDFGYEPDEFFVFPEIPAIDESCQICNEPQLDVASATPSPNTDGSNLLEEQLSLNHLTCEQKSQLTDILRSFPRLYTGNKHTVGTVPGIEHRIHTDANVPVCVRQWRLPQSTKEIIKQECKTMLQQGVIEPSTSPWSSPVVLVKKKDGSVRFCVDYRGLNKVTTPDSYPLPRIDELMDSLSGKTWFTVLDSRAAYWAISVHPEDRPKTAFTDGNRLYQFRRLPFGLSTAPTTFQRTMDIVLSSVLGRHTLAYLDDVVVASTSFEAHLNHLKETLGLLENAGMKLNLHKCEFARQEVKLLGFIVGRDGIRPNPDKVLAIAAMKRPRSARDIRRFLGACGFFRRHIPRFATIAKPLTQLTKKNVKFEWGDAAQQAFDTLKEALVRAPVLRLPDFDRPFEVHTDASGQALGAVLLQREADGTPHAVAYWSRVLKETETRYPIIDLEALAVVEAIRIFDPYIYGRCFTVWTDHSPLTYVFSRKTKSTRLSRFAHELSDYNFTLHYKQGASNYVPDLLSRPPGEPIRSPDYACPVGNSVADPEPNPDTPLLEVPPSVQDQQMQEPQPHQMPNLTTLASQQMREQQLQDPVCTDLIAWLERRQSLPKIRLPAAISDFELYDGVLYHLRHFPDRVVKQIYVPHQLCNQALHLAHQPPTAAHPGALRTYQNLCNNWFFPNMLHLARTYVASCETCQRRKAPVVRAPMQGHPPSKAPLEMVSADLMDLRRSAQGFRYVLSIIDHHTRYLQLVPLRDKSASRVLKAFVDHFITLFGPPAQLHTDNGLEFSSDEWRSLLKELEVRHSFSVAYHPQSNGVVERSNRVVKDALAALVQQSPSQWPIHLPAVRFALNSAIHRSTSDQPLYLLTGRMALFPRGLTNLQTIDEGQMVKCLADARRIAIKTTLETREANKRYYDRKAKPLHLNEGSLVLRKVEGSTRALDSRWKGPFRVLKKIGPVTYDILELQQPHRTMRVHANQLRPFVPASEIDFVEEGDQLPYPLVNFEFDAAPESSELLTDSENGSGDGNGLLRI